MRLSPSTRLRYPALSYPLHFLINRVDRLRLTYTRSLSVIFLISPHRLFMISSRSHALRYVPTSCSPPHVFRCSLHGNTMIFRNLYIPCACVREIIVFARACSVTRSLAGGHHRHKGDQARRAIAALRLVSVLPPCQTPSCSDINHVFTSQAHVLVRDPNRRLINACTISSICYQESPYMTASCPMHTNQYPVLSTFPFPTLLELTRCRQSAHNYLLQKDESL